MSGPPREGRVIEPLHPPSAYSPAQLDRAVRIAAQLATIRRGTFVYTEPPRRCPS
jgi:hypothetical protein